jgi:S1-C subfamily serine protease
VVIAGVEPNSPADRAGLAAGDVLIAVDGQPVTGADDLIRILTGDMIGRSVEIALLRDGQRRTLSLTPEERKHKKS